MFSSAPNPLFVWIRDAARRLEEIGAGNPRLEAEYLMAAALGVSRIQLWLRDVPPDPSQVVTFEAMLARRLGREPLQYVLSSAEFAGLALLVGPGVFIPRSETEILVERVETRLRSGHGGCAAAPRIVDVGTGCGAILLALLDRFPEGSGLGIDRSSGALAWARRNAQALQMADRARFAQGDLLAGVLESFDAVVSNPPYIPDGECADLAPEIRDHEPPEALFAGADGLDVIRRLVPQAARVLPAGGLLAMEIGITQAQEVAQLLDGPDWSGVEIRPDLAGRPRVALATRV